MSFSSLLNSLWNSKGNENKGNGYQNAPHLFTPNFPVSPNPATCLRLLLCQPMSICVINVSMALRLFRVLLRLQSRFAQNAMEMFVRFTTTLAWFLKVAAFIKQIHVALKPPSQRHQHPKLRVHLHQKMILSQLQMGNA